MLGSATVMSWIGEGDVLKVAVEQGSTMITVKIYDVDYESTDAAKFKL